MQKEQWPSLLGPCYCVDKIQHPFNFVYNIKNVKYQANIILPYFPTKF